MPRGAKLAGLNGTLVIHVGALAALLVSATGTPKAFPPTFAVELVAAPPSSGTSAATARTTPPPPAPAPVVNKSKPKAAPVRTTTTTAAKTPVSKTAAPVKPLPGETPGTGSDIANVKLDGKAFPYPEYLRNLVSEIYRRWNRPTGNAALTTEIGFVILRDGTVKEIGVVSSSRSYSFDLEARGAIESAAAQKAFGPLPAGYPADYLQISFVFTPRRLP